MLLVFKHQCGTILESVVSSVSGPMVHVDMIPMGQEQAVCHYYTSYMFETFSKNPLSSTHYTDTTHTALLVDLELEELKRARDFLDECVKHGVPYNYPDLLPCMIASSQSTMVQDVALSAKAEAPELPSSMFCSQAVVLCLRKAFGTKASEEEKEDDDDNTRKRKQLVAALSSVNSRLTTPSALYKAVVPFTKRIPIERADTPKQQAPDDSRPQKPIPQ